MDDQLGLHDYKPPIDIAYFLSIILLDILSTLNVYYLFLLHLWNLKASIRHYGTTHALLYSVVMLVGQFKLFQIQIGMFIGKKEQNKLGVIVW